MDNYENFECPCGGHYKINNKRTHIGTQKHMRYERNINNPINPLYRRYRRREQ
jgi:hypothetical protein